jgi:hypothetical protein
MEPEGNLVLRTGAHTLPFVRRPLALIGEGISNEVFTLFSVAGIEVGIWGRTPDGGFRDVAHLS